MLEEDLQQILRAGHESFRALAGKKVFLTGGTGYIGRGLLRAFGAHARAGTPALVTVLSRNPGGFLETYAEFRDCPWLDFVTGDIRDFTTDLAPYHYLLHGSAVDDGTDELIAATTLLGTRNLARQLGWFRGRLLFLSSGAALGDTVYGRAKKAAEDILRERGSIARIYSVWGGDLPLTKHYAVAHFMRAALQGRPIEIAGDGRPVRSYMYLSDVVTWLLRILTHGTLGTAYPVGSEHAISLLQLALRIDALNGATAAGLHVTGRSPDFGAAPVYVPDTSFTRARLGLAQTVSTDQGLEKFWAFSRGRGS